MQQRYYDPIAGRFLSVDPVVTDANTGKGFGLYTYVDNNPYSRIDPDGRESIGIEKYLGVGGGITIGYDRTTGELALTVSAGIGLGGGGGLTPTSDNGRAAPDGGSTAMAGVVVNAFAKASAGVSTPVGSVGGEVKVVGGKDFGEGKPVGGADASPSLSKPEGFKADATLAAGGEVSVYVKPGAVLNAVVGAVKNAANDVKDTVQKKFIELALKRMIPEPKEVQN